VSSQEAPDYVEPFVGWRVWDVVVVDGAVRLRSRRNGVIWPVRATLEAVCLDVAGEHRVEDCSCGIYASKTLRYAVPYLSREFRRDSRVAHRVIGRVSLWGRIVEGDRGYRGSRAYPLDLFVPAPPAGLRRYLSGMAPARLAPAGLADGLTAYGVPVTVVPCANLPGLAAAIAAHDERRRRSAQAAA
jgi:hypothetical protein